MRIESGKMELNVLEDLLNAKRIIMYNVKLYDWGNSRFMDDSDKTKELENYNKFKLIEHYNANKTREYIIVCF